MRPLHGRLVLLFLTLSGATGCNNVDEAPGPYTLEAVQATDTTVLPGTQFSPVLRVIEDGHPVDGLQVDWLADAGTIEPAQTMSGPDGLVTATWQLPRVVGSIGEISGPPGEFSATARLGSGETVRLVARAEPFRADQMDANYELGCAVRGDEVFCWPGAGNFPPHGVILPASLAHPREVRVSDGYLCIRSASGDVHCGNEDSGSFVPVTGAPPLVDLVAARSRFCGRAADSTAWCWSWRDGSLAASQVGPQRFVELRGGGQGTGTHACGRTNDGVTLCWGTNAFGQLGNGTTTDSPTPVLVSGMHDFISVRVGSLGACGVERDYSVWCWGRQVGPDASEPVKVTLPGIVGPRFEVGYRAGWTVNRGSEAAYFDNFAQDVDPTLPLLDIVELKADWKTICVRSREGYIYCSYGIGSSSVYPFDLIPLPRPE